MGWDQSYCVESRQAFWLRYFKFDPVMFVKEQMSKQGLTVTRVESLDEESDMEMGPGHLERITLSNGEVWGHQCVQSKQGDDWGHDTYEYRLVSAPPAESLVEPTDDANEKLALVSEDVRCAE